MKETERSVSFVLYTPEFKQVSEQTQINVRLYERFAELFSSAEIKTDRFIVQGPVIPVQADSDNPGPALEDREQDGALRDQETQSSQSQPRILFPAVSGAPAFVQLADLSQSNYLQNRLENSDGLTRQLAAARTTESVLSAGAELFVYTGEMNRSDVLPPYNQARFGVLYTDVPRNPAALPCRILEAERPEGSRTWLKAFFGLIKKWRVRSAIRWEWNTRLASYNAFWVPSEFCQKVMMKRWKQFGKVVYPPLTEEPVEWSKEEVARKKRQIVCSVNGSSNVDLIIEGFGKLYVGLPELAQEGWKLVLAVEQFGGGSGIGFDRAGSLFQKSAELMERVRQKVPASAVERVSVENLSERLKLFRESALYLDATGFGCDWQKNPEDLPGFHTAAADAMSVGAIPILFCAGSAPEIVLHGQSGYLWHKPEEMWACVVGLIQDASLRTDVAILSTVRAQFFSRALWQKRTQLTIPKK